LFTGFFIISGRSGQRREGTCALCSGTEFHNSYSDFSLIHNGYTEHNVNEVQTEIIQLTKKIEQSYILFFYLKLDKSSNPRIQIRICIKLKWWIRINIGTKADSQYGTG
jgi:hypothetical protein